MRRILVVGSLAALGLTGTAHAAHRQTPEQQRVAVIDAAEVAQQQADKSCLGGLGELHPTIVDGGAGPQVSSVIAAFRRPATDADRAVLDQPFALVNPFFATVGRDGARVLQAPDGTQVNVISAQTTRQVGLARPDYDRCHTAIRKRLVKLLRHKDADFKRKTLKEYDQVVRSERPPATFTPTEGLSSDGGGGPFDLARFRKEGSIGSSGTSSSSSEVTALVPDGVATVRLSYAKTKAYKKAAVVNLPVANNVAHGAVPRSAPNAFGKVTFLAADGTVLSAS